MPQQGPALVLANHQSHLDPVIVGAVNRRKLRFLARDSLFFWPLSWLIQSLGAIPINREGSGLAGLRATLRILKSNQALALFPEGTRSIDGQLQELKPGFCAVARRAGATIIPMAIAGSFNALPPGKGRIRLRRVAVQFAPPISPEEVSAIDDKQLVELVAERIGKAFADASQRI